LTLGDGSKTKLDVDPFPVSIVDVGTLKNRYPRIQALSEDKEQGVHPRAATQAVASDHTSLMRWALEPPRVPRPRTSPPC
jgi:hypothetical protein